MIEVIGPIHVLIGLGFLARRLGLIPDDAVRSLSLITFGVVTPALLFRSMAHLGLQGMSLVAAASYFSGAVLVFGLVLWAAHRFLPDDTACQFRLGQPTVLALGATFSNTIMLGIPMIRLAHGEAGVGVLISIIALHALIMMTLSTFALEFSRRRHVGGEGGHVDDSTVGTGMDLWTPVRNSLLHPVTFPILLGLAWATLDAFVGFGVPTVLDVALKLLGEANAPLSLILLGASLNLGRIADLWRRAALIMIVKLVVFPALVYVLGRWVFSLSPLALSVTTLTAALSSGANVYLFAQRYDVEVEWASTLVTLSTLVCVLSLPFWLHVLR